MTADEIRDQFNFDPNGMPPTASFLQLGILAEIAAQLAEANGLKRMEMGGVMAEAAPVPAPVHPDYLPIPKAEWNAAQAAIEAARQLIDPNHTENGAAYVDNLKKAIAAWDDHQMPF